MNRRNFIVTASVSLALASSQVAAQRTTSSEVLESELTGGKVDFSQTALTFVQQHIDDADGSEHFHFTTELGSRFDIYFWPVASGPSGAFVDANVEIAFDILGGETLGSETYDDGGWVAIHTGFLQYHEHQMGAYPGHDLVTFIWNENDEFDYIFAEAQKILVDGMAPMLFTEDSDILAISAEHPPASATTQTASTTRTSRGSSSTTESTSTRSTRNASTADEDSDDPSASTGGEAVAQVAKHQSDFHTSYSEVSPYLKIWASETAMKEEKDDAFFQLLNISAEWQNATAYAKDVVFSTQEAELESIYLDWATAQREMGFAFEGALLGSNDVDTYVVAEDAFFVIDDQLTGSLSALQGFRITPRLVSFTRTLGRQLEASRALSLHR